MVGMTDSHAEPAGRGARQEVELGELVGWRPLTRRRLTTDGVLAQRTGLSSRQIRLRDVDGLRFEQGPWSLALVLSSGRTEIAVPMLRVFAMREGSRTPEELVALARALEKADLGGADGVISVLRAQAAHLADPHGGGPQVSPMSAHVGGPKDRSDFGSWIP